MPLVLSVTLALLAPGLAEAGAERPPTAAPPVVVDAEGQVVGVLAGVGASVAADVLVRRGEVETVVGLSGDRFLEGYERVGFEAPDCTGTPWIVASFSPGAPPFYREGGVGPDLGLYVAAGSRESRTIQSVWVAPLFGPSACQGQAPTATDVFPAALLAPLDGFTPPFRLR